MADPKTETVLSFLLLKIKSCVELLYADADLGAALIAVEEEIGAEMLPAWIDDLRPRAIERGIRHPLTLDNARRCIKTERYRRAAGPRFKKIVERGDSYVRPIITLPETDIDDLVGKGIPTKTGRVPVEEATVRQIKEAAKAVRRRNGTSGPTAKAPKSHFELAMEHLQKAGALSDEQMRQLQPFVKPAPATAPGDVPRTKPAVNHPAAPTSGDLPRTEPVKLPAPRKSGDVPRPVPMAPLVTSLSAKPKRKGHRGRGRVA